MKYLQFPLKTKNRKNEAAIADVFQLFDEFEHLLRKR
jgi:hypothetical protein